MSSSTSVTEAAQRESRPWGRTGALLFLALVAVVAAVLPRAAGMGFSQDDRELLFERPAIRDLDPGRILCEPFFGKRSRAPIHRPLTALSLALDRRVFGADAAALHGVNLVLHALSAWVLAALLARVAGGGRGVFLLCLLFHPVMAEQAGWIAGRSVSLMLLFGALGLFALDPSGGPAGPARFAAAASAFTAAGLAREDGLVFGLLPVVLWRGRRLPAGVGPGAVAFVAVGALRRLALGTSLPPLSVPDPTAAADRFGHALAMLLFCETPRTMSEGLPPAGIFRAALPLMGLFCVVAFMRRHPSFRGLAWMFAAFLPFAGLFRVPEGPAARFASPLLPGLLLALAPFVAQLVRARGARAWARAAPLVLVWPWLRQTATIGNQERAFAQVLAAFPKSRRARLMHALGVAANGDRRRAIALLRALMADEPGYAKAYTNLGSLLLAAGRPAGARRVLAAAAGRFPDNALPPLLLGVAARRARRWAAALRFFDEAVARDPLSARGFRERARCLAALGRMEEARTALARAAALDPGAPPLAALRARLSTGR